MGHVTLPNDVTIAPLYDHTHLPILIQPTQPNLDMASWLAKNLAFIESSLWQEGALLFRGFGVENAAGFEKFIQATSSSERMNYRDRSTPRSEVKDRIYTATDYPATENIHLHNEGTYWKRWPLKLYFCCLKAPTTGGQTPIADARRILRRLSPRTRRSFESKRWMLVRNFHENIGLSWQEVFQTNERDQVERYCHENQIEFKWLGAGLQTRQIRDAIATHPRSKTKSWFNHAAFFHVSSLNPQMAEALLQEFGEENLPYQTYYGDGSPIPRSVLDEIREAYRQETVLFTWQEGDIMLLDNMSVCHGREPFGGERVVVVAMTDPSPTPGP